MKGYTREKMREIIADRSALRKCRNAVSAGGLSPISSAVGRNGAVGDKENARAGARNYPRRRQILRLRRCAAAPHPSRLRRATCLPAGRSVRGSDTPPACHSTPRTHQGEGLRGASFNGADLQGEGLSLCGPGTRLPVTSSGGRLTPADGRGDEDRMEVGSENTWKKEWNFCR